MKLDGEKLGQREKEREKSKKYYVGNKILSDEENEELENILRNITIERNSISNALLYCFDHAESSAEIVLIISQSLKLDETLYMKKVLILEYIIFNIFRKLARLYLISDILFNSSVPSSACFWSFRMYFEYKLPEIFENINETILKNKEDEQLNFIEKVLKLLIVWNDWVIFDTKFLFGLEALLNRPNKKKEENEETTNSNTIFEYDTSTQTGIKLKCLEEDLKSQSINYLEKSCKINGLPLIGSKNKLIERLLILEEYKLKVEKSNSDAQTKDAIYNSNKKQTPKKNEILEKTVYDSKSTTKNGIALLKSFRNINNRNLNDSSLSEIDGYCKTYLDVLRLLQSRAEKFNISDIDGMEFDELDEYIFDIKKKLLNFEENIDGKI